MMKILIITNHSYMYYQFRREITAKLLEEHEVYLSTPCVGREDDLASMGCKIIETYVDRRGINPVTDLKLLFTYKKMIKEIKPDKVITYSIKPNIYAGIVCRFLNIPYYANVQGLGTAFQKQPLATIVSMLYKFALKKANVVFFENQGNVNVFIENNIIPTSKIKVLNGAGVNLAHYYYSKYPTNNKLHFLFVGRIMKEKGVEELFYSIRELSKEYNDFVLDIIGFFEDEYKDTVVELEKKGLVKFHGFQQETRPFYEKAHCVVLPSYHEGMSNVLLEGSAMGRPIITSNIPGCKEAVNENETGFLCIVQDKQSLYRCMKKFIMLSHAERENMGIKARNKMKQEFSKEVVVDATITSIMSK